MRRPIPKRWRVMPGDIQAEARLQMEIGAHPIVARLLVQRGITTPEAAEAFLNPSLDRMHDPFLLPDAEAACERLKQALHNNEKILVHGDYDGDGVTSAALWTRCLRSLGGQVDVFVPHRKRDGYDIRTPIIEQARQEGVKLIVTTDCGIQRVDEVEFARQYGMDVIITDHHTPNAGGELPKAVAVVNPQRKDSRYPFPHLAGVGVAFKLCEALTCYLGHKAASFRRSFLDLAAIGTITDVMPLLDENRILVKHGLDALRNTKKPGLQALIDVAGYAEKPLDVRSVGFGLGPRLNAASRMDETQIALDLLLTKDPAQGRLLAERLNQLNLDRREETTRILDAAMEQVAQQDVEEARCLVVSGADWSSGIIGLVAGRIVERFNRPCVAIALNEATGSGRGSARSFHPFNIFHAIDACKTLLQEYGGHAHAAGLAIDNANVADFAAQMNRLAGALLTEEDCVPTIEVAMEIAPDDVCAELILQLAEMAPFGSGNQKPFFISRSVPLQNLVVMGKEKQHLKLMLKADRLNNGIVPGLWWNRAELSSALESLTSLDICYTPEFNFFNGARSIQFMMEDIQPPEW